MFIFMNVLLSKLCGTGRDSHGPGLRMLVFHSVAPSKVHDVNKKTSFSEPLPRSSVLIHGWRMMIFISHLPFLRKLLEQNKRFNQ